MIASIGLVRRQKVDIAPEDAYFRLKLSSENGFDGLRTLDLPRSTFQEPDDCTGDEDLSPPLDLARL